MRPIRIRHLLLLLCWAPLAGCFTTVHFSDKERLECKEPPPPECRPEGYNEITLDTSSAQTIRSTHYLAIDRVRGLDGPGDEFSVTFQTRGDGRTALATSRRTRRDPDEIGMVRFQEVDQGKIERNVGANGISGSIGGGAVASDGDSIHFAARMEGTVMGDYDLFSGEYRSGTITSSSRRAASTPIHWDAQPAIAPDGRAIYFASDRAGGFGGTDIYISRRQGDGSWSDPQNLGPAINTPCDELSPYISGDGTWLYFSSAGHATVGGYDLFRAPLLADQFGKAENLGRPINTPDDEIFPSAPSGANPDTLLYYSSNQTGSEGFDIYVLHRLRRMGTITRSDPRTVMLKGTIRDGVGRPVDSALVTIEQRDPPGDIDSTRTNSQGNYQFEVKEGKRYEVVAGSDSTLYVREEVRIPISDGRTQVTRDITLSDTVTFRVNFPFNNASDPYRYTLDDRGLPTDLAWSDMIDKAAGFLKKFNGSSQRFEVVGHTDPVGSDPFNMDLGRRRAEFIRQELVRRGVRSELFTVRTEGETRPLPQREGESEDLFHARLRRVELIRR